MELQLYKSNVIGELEITGYSVQDGEKEFNVCCNKDVDKLIETIEVDSILEAEVLVRLYKGEPVSLIGLRDYDVYKKQSKLKLCQVILKFNLNFEDVYYNTIKQLMSEYHTLNIINNKTQTTHMTNGDFNYEVDILTHAKWLLYAKVVFNDDNLVELLSRKNKLPLQLV